MTNTPHDPTSAVSSEWAETKSWLDTLDRGTHPPEPIPDDPDPSEYDIVDLDDERRTLDLAAIFDDHQVHDAADDDAPPAQITNPPAPEDFPRIPEPRFNKPLALGFAAAITIITAVVTVTLLILRPDHPTAADTSTAATRISVAPAPPTTAAPDTNADTPIPYTASASCPPGSTAAQAVAGTDPSRAWVCVRGGVDGQVLTLDLGRTMVITAVSITPCWPAADPTGADQWTAHRVVTRAQWILNDDATTVLTQDTGNVRGDAVQPLPNHGVLASKLTMIVLQTSRAPADTTSSTPTTSGGSLLDDVLAPVTAPAPSATAGTDPADATFAVASIKILGHAPQ
ncbi:hypothetical protein FHT40_006118 [Mycolicibacterium sp. BK556]|uniref:hypothetical protein n=1 Tax=unclassified Mycolicibacterium TaxID=2636767 RepID=UPI00161A0AB7|nr:MULTISPECIES: hypothetical protein [unclassified Mycolicibacterium]MBB3606427.1 hypothetical protein [Mycolicibacterium sp. BK556]MBB3636327.1 hypothetical protein [Mycolicibacterium sp. BK607]